MKTGLAYSPNFLKHDTGPNHPESAQRLQAIMDHLSMTGILRQVQQFTPTERDSQLVELVHTPSYIQRVKEACLMGQPYIDTLDNPICSASFEIAVEAVTACCVAADFILNGTWECCMVLPRPPGHHAEADRAMGFCLFNNVAVVARYVQQHYGLQRIAIIDYDVHHGNGTQHIFENDPQIYYISIHRYPFYPGTGGSEETGLEAGRGYTRNFPFPVGTGDERYIKCFRTKIADILLQYEPEFVILSSGFDAHQQDPLGGMALTTAGFGELTAILTRLAQETCGGKLLSVLEGGYDLEALAESVAVHLQTLSEAT
jgi:acetoin utilization deacetylase AcuC-like enzyme